MTPYEGSFYKLYQRFRDDLSNAHSTSRTLEACGRILPSMNARSAAIVRCSNIQSVAASPDFKTMDVVAATGQEALWSAYAQLCRTNREPLSRIVRLSPHPIALSELAHHTRLSQRTNDLTHLLNVHSMTDLLAVPVVGRRTYPSTMVVISGRAWALRPTYSYMLTQIARDFVRHVDQVAANETSGKAPLHTQLTPRQLEIAEWVIAGKTDWEIGEILQISRKTVNFHVENIKRHYGVKSRNQFIAAIVHDGGLCPA